MGASGDSYSVRRRCARAINIITGIQVQRGTRITRMQRIGRIVPGAASCARAAKKAAACCAKESYWRQEQSAESAASAKIRVPPLNLDASQTHSRDEPRPAIESDHAYVLTSSYDRGSQLYGLRIRDVTESQPGHDGRARGGLAASLRWHDAEWMARARLRQRTDRTLARDRWRDREDSHRTGATAG